MNAKERFLGLIRELLTAGGALAFGACDGAASVIGLLVSIAAIGWAFHHHEGPQIDRDAANQALDELENRLPKADVIEEK